MVGQRRAASLASRRVHPLAAAQAQGRPQYRATSVLCPARCGFDKAFIGSSHARLPTGRRGLYFRKSDNLVARRKCSALMSSCWGSGLADAFSPSTSLFNPSHSILTPVLHTGHGHKQAISRLHGLPARMHSWDMPTIVRLKKKVGPTKRCRPQASVRRMS